MSKPEIVILQPGDNIFRVFLPKNSKTWYYCVYELVKLGKTPGVVEIAPIIAYEGTSYNKHTTMLLDFSKLKEGEWINLYNFVTTDAEVAKKVYKEVTENGDKTD